CLKAMNKKLYVINYIFIEQYLRSVVPCESISSWPGETLKAQAIAARTYAYKKFISKRSYDFDLYDDTWDQVYGGVEKETKRTDKMVEQTKGIIITHNKKPIHAFYTSNNGGYSADVKSIFGLKQMVYLKAKPDLASSKAQMANWTRIKSKKTIEKILSDRHLTIGSLINIYPTQRGPSGRVLKIKLIGDQKEIEIMTKPFLTGGG
ncbi:MAG: stage II sporulation protein D, partial [Candidatus Magnetoglobus multicellularis str. Araruama]